MKAKGAIFYGIIIIMGFLGEAALMALGKFVLTILFVLMVFGLCLVFNAVYSKEIDKNIQNFKKSLDNVEEHKYKVVSDIKPWQIEKVYVKKEADDGVTVIIHTKKISAEEAASFVYVQDKE